MKKNNVIVFALLVLLSAFLLWLWYYLGFNRVDNPLDLVLSIIWWIAIALGIALIVRLEQVRRRRIRTVYVDDRSTFNSEKGLLPLDAAVSAQDFIAGMLDDLKYDFTREDFPEPEDFQPRYFIRTEKFEAEKRDDDENDVSDATDASGVGEPSAVDAAVGEAAAADAAEPVAEVAADAVAPAQPAADAAEPAVASRVRPTTWKGEVVVVGDDGDPRTFDTPEELAAILASLTKAA